MDDFFIGWQADPPQIYAQRSRLSVWVLALVLPILAAVIVWNQQGFSRAVFEFGQLTELEGVLHYQPVPILQLDSGVSLILVGTGKHGANVILNSMSARYGASLEGKRLSIGGYLIFHDGKGLFELPEATVFKIISPERTIPLEKPEILGDVTLCGEIADPKCFFGVMKPCEGKPHRSCAIRCISGGIPPVLKVESKSGKSNYYLLRGAQGDDINLQLLNYVADGVKIHGQLELHGNWYVLRIDPLKDIYREKPYWIGPGETMCKGTN